MKLYRVECVFESSFTATNWTRDLAKVTKTYEKRKKLSGDEKEEISVGSIRLVTIDI